MKPMVAKKRAIYFILFCICFVIFVPVIVMYSLGYTLDGMTLTKRGGLYVFVPESGSEIYLNNEIKKTTGAFQKELFLQNLSPRQYLVLVANEDYWSWAKYVDVKEKEVSALFPFLVPRSIELREIVAATTTAVAKPTKATSTISVAGEYERILALFKEATTTTNTAPALSGVTSNGEVVSTTTATTSPESKAISRKKMRIWGDGDKVFARWAGSESSIPPYFCKEEICDSKLLVLDTASDVRHVDFYPKRDDAIIVSLSEGVFALEIDTRQYHNFYPLFKGKMPDFRIDDGEVFIKDGDFVGQLMEL